MRFDHCPAGRGARAALLAVVLALLAACSASTRLVHNEKASPQVRAKSFKDYKEILFIPPKADPRAVVPRTVQALEGMGFRVSVMDPDKPIDAAQGTGFVVGAPGHVLTCAHVLGDATSATVVLDGQRLFADVVQADKQVDLALLKLRGALPASAVVLNFRSGAKGYSMGEDVFTIGYPLSRVLGNSARMSRGLVSATAGLRDDPNQLQVSAEIQPGNSGGPLLDREGLVIGVIQQTINPWRVAQATGGALPQNINFSLKGEPVIEFLRRAGAFDALRFDQPATPEQASHGVAKVLAGQVPDDSSRRDKMVVRLNYVSVWDVWYRFRLFVLSAYDFDTQETLFAAGQTHDNMVSNEDVVIRETLEQFRKAIASR
jgi:serine protease Do